MGHSSVWHLRTAQCNDALAAMPTIVYKMAAILKPLREGPVRYLLCRDLCGSLWLCIVT